MGRKKWIRELVMMAWLVGLCSVLWAGIALGQEDAILGNAFVFSSQPGNALPDQRIIFSEPDSGNSENGRNSEPGSGNSENGRNSEPGSGNSKSSESSKDSASDKRETASRQQEDLKLHAQSAVLMDGKSGRVLWEKNGDQVRPMASTTKIMTCILALEAGLGEKERVTQVSGYAASQPQVHLGMRTGQRFFTRDLLHSLMLESHNDSAVAVAEAVAGSVPEFAKRMNQKARELGCTDTWFITPNGLDGTEKDEQGMEHTHSTTARDLATILNYCILHSPKSEEFLEITKTMDYHFQDADGKGSYQCHNHNNLFSMMDGVLSGKTGFTGGAGYCYTGAVEDEGRVFTIAILGCGWPPHKTYKWSDARTLLNYGKENYRYRNLFREIALEPVPVKNGVQREKQGEGSQAGWKTEDIRIPLSIEASPRKLEALAGENDQVRIMKNLPSVLEAPVARGSQVGTVEYYLNGQKIASYPILARESAERFSFSWCAGQVKSAFFLQ